MSHQSFYEFYCPVKLVVGPQALEHIPFELGVRNADKPMIITDKGVLGAGLVKHVMGVFEGDKDNIVVFDDVPPDSSLDTVRNAAKMYRDNGCNAIIAVGGGSVIDTSKGVNILVSLGGDDLMQYSGAHVLKEPLKPFFVIPTTAGTGSEATLVSVISDDDGIKQSFVSSFLLPDVAVLDPRMTLTLPPHITAMTGMDAMTHAVEAYTCMGANPISDAYAMTAISKVSKNLPKVMDNPKDKDARLQLAEASTMAGIAFSNSMVGLVHSLGHALGGVCHLPHGLCMNLLMPYVLEYNKDVNGERIGELLRPLLNNDEAYANVPSAERTMEAIKYIRAMRDDLYEQCQLPRTLQETGKVEQSQLEAIADVAINDGSIIYNPKEADKTDLMNILNRAWAG